MLLDRHRITRLIELADLERRMTGPERMLREEDVALLVKAAYDDASEAARAAFMARVQAMPVTAWPWSAVQVKYIRPTTPSVASGGGGRMVVGFSPTPTALIPAALMLLRGQVDSADAEPGNRFPDRGAPESQLWEPLYLALDAWDTQSITRWIGPQGWVRPASGQSTQPPPQDGATSGPPAGSMAPPPASTPTETPPSPTLSWRSPAAIAVGTTLASTVGVVLFSLRRRRAPANTRSEAS